MTQTTLSVTHSKDMTTIGPHVKIALLEAEIERLWLENWQLKGALGYAVPGDIPEGSWRCGVCEARAVAQYTQNKAPRTSG